MHSTAVTMRENGGWKWCRINRKELIKRKDIMNLILILYRHVNAIKSSQCKAKCIYLCISNKPRLFNNKKGSKINFNKQLVDCY